MSGLGSPNIQQAFEALAMAAASEGQTMSLEQSKALMSKVDILISKEEVAVSKLDILISKEKEAVSKLDILISKEEAIRVEVAKQTKINSLQMAMNMLDRKLLKHSNKSGFRFYAGGDLQFSDELIRSIIAMFVRGLGQWIPRGSLNQSYQPTEAEGEALRTMLSEEIHSLTGSKPRLEKRMNGKMEQWVIFYE